jgi:hypothetical protein
VIRDSLFYPKNDLFKITWIHPHKRVFRVVRGNGIPRSGGFLASFFPAFSGKMRMSSSARPFREKQSSYLSGVFSFFARESATTLDYTVLFWILRAMLHGHTNRKTLPA